MHKELFRARIDYDDEFDLLSIRRPDYKTTFNLEVGNLILDFTSNEFIGIEIQNARQWLSDIFGKKIQLEDITGAKIGFVEKPTLLTLLIELKIKNEPEIYRDITVPKYEPVSVLAR